MGQKKVWNQIASGWSGWRNQPHRIYVNYAGEWPPGRILDIGCGNGRNSLPFAKKGFKCYGIDFSKAMIKEAGKFAKRNGMKINLKVADQGKLPFKDGTFDYCISNAALHHIETEIVRLRALKEIKRVLKPEGQAIISVWNKLQPKHIFKPSDVLEPWKTKKETLYRYYHLFTPWELKKLIETSGLDILKSSRMVEKNIEFVVKK
jgi:ubiquinone/menaquinone biosynthesis C-methylase UbiE